jgi:ATP-binding cassette subfamily A (ABC1) protein 3
MVAIEAFNLSLLVRYIDAIKPGKYGVPKPFYFVFLPSFWCNYSSSSKQMAMETMTNLDYNVNAHEEEPVDIPVGISIKNLTKIYNKRSLKKRKVAVDNLSLNMYKGQITALLGHNGAGKTTTMSILTGLFPPTSGTAYINGLSVINDIDLIRRNLGICPQHNVLFDRLTVSEHLKFFARLKGSSGKQLKNEIPQLIDDLLLLDKKNTQSKNLSGGMKRKLSVGIALVGGSEIVILDEPTSGMDPYARRATWDLLAKYKEGRTILLTTHFMDEADLLGDRIAIMAEGKLRCSGSSLFLKSRYGVGYHMTMVKEPHCDSSAVTSLVTSLVAGAQQVTDVGAELSFILPSQASTQFPHLFDVLDDKKNELGISSFGISVTTMEEVFIHVGSGADEEDLYLQKSKSSVRDKRRGLEKTPGALETSFHDKNQKDNEIQEIYANPAHYDVPPDGAGPEVLALPSDGARLSHDYDTVVEIHSPRNSRYGTFNSSQDIKLNTGIILWLQQFRAVFLKRFYNSLRFWVAIIWQFIIPMVFVLWGMILGKSNLSLNVDDPSRSLSLQDTALSSNITFFWADFGGQSSNMFNSEDVGVLGITDFFDFTSDIQSIKDSVRNYNDPNDCCNYKHQFLDKFCNSITLDQLNASGTICPNNDNFGYRPCVSKCLSCCNATSSKIPTCTDPSLQDTSQGSRRIPRTADNYCPFPPSVSIDDQYGQDLPEGPLEGINVYVAEKLLNLSLELEINDFFVRFQGGFVLHPPEPSYSVCSCNNSQVSCGDLGNTLTNWTFSLPPPAIEGISTIPAPFSSLLSGICYNPLLVPPSPSDCELFNNTDWDYNYDYLTMDCANYGTCSGNGVCNCTGSTQCSTGECGCRIGRTSQPTPPQSNRMAVTVWYNNQPFHMIAAALNSFYNVYLSRTLNSSVTISVTNYPLPRELESQISDAQSDFLGFSISSTAVFGLSFLFASFIIFLVQERYSKAKHLQFVSGVQASSYWLATFSWDLINSLLPSILTVIIFAAFQVEGYTGENIGAVFLLVLLGCWASIPVNYVASFLFSNPLVAFCLMFVFFYFGSVIFQVIVFLLQTDNPDVSETLSYVFLIHPAYA